METKIISKYIATTLVNCHMKWGMLMSFPVFYTDHFQNFIAVLSTHRKFNSFNVVPSPVTVFFKMRYTKRCKEKCGLKMLEADLIGRTVTASCS